VTHTNFNAAVLDSETTYMLSARSCDSVVDAQPVLVRCRGQAKCSPGRRPGTVLDHGQAATTGGELGNYRYERASTIITSNKSITAWPTMLAGDEALAAAILDRLLHHCHGWCSP
jgi:hypothetical protein